MIEICSISASYGKNRVLSDISLTVPDGKITVVAGLNGCGKTTLLRSVAGLMPYSGTVKVDGTDVKTLGRRETAKKVAYLAQMKSPSDLTVFRTVLCGRYPHLPFPHIFTQSDRDISEEAVNTMNLSDLADRKTSQLSGGLLQKTSIAMVIAQQAGNILLDEPTTFLDASSKLQLMNRVRLMAEEGKAVFAVLHDLPMALRYADKVAVIKDGSIFAEGSPEEIYSSGIAEKVFGVKLYRTEVDDGIRYFY